MKFHNIPKALAKKLRELSGEELQIQCGAILRALMIKHLEANKTTFAQYMHNKESVKFVAGKYLDKKEDGDYEKFLADQKTGWGTYQSLMLLAELFKFNAWIKVNNQKPYCVYSHSHDSSTPNIVLHNDNNLHWYYSESEATSGHNGSCLFHAIAQALSDALKNESQPQLVVTNPETTPVDTSPETILVGTSSIEKTNQSDIRISEEDVVIADQRMIEQSIIRTMKQLPEEPALEPVLNATHEETSIHSPSQDAAQIQADREFAFEVAREELVSRDQQIKDDHKLALELHKKENPQSQKDDKQIQTDYELALSLQKKEDAFRTKQVNRDFELALQLQKKLDSQPKEKSRPQYYVDVCFPTSTNPNTFFNSQNREMAAQNRAKTGAQVLQKESRNTSIDLSVS
jgi:hypothetical protein